MSEQAHNELATVTAASLTFRCNICGGPSRVLSAELERERPSCTECGSTLRWRSLVHLLSKEIHGRDLCLADFPERPDVVGIGMTDWVGYAGPFGDLFSYTNTYFDVEPVLDITRPGDEYLGTADFVISSEVFEHVAPPVSAAFANLYALLKPGGFVVFTVPYVLEGETKEWFPRLNSFQLVEREDGVVLENVTVDGELEIYDDLLFHAGGTGTLEMRVFSEPSLRAELAAAGFCDIRVEQTACLEHGIVWQTPWSLPVLARRPPTD